MTADSNYLGHIANLDGGAVACSQRQSRAAPAQLSAASRRAFPKSTTTMPLQQPAFTPSSPRLTASSPPTSARAIGAATSAAPRLCASSPPRSARAIGTATSAAPRHLLGASASWDANARGRPLRRQTVASKQGVPSSEGSMASASASGKLRTGQVTPAFNVPFFKAASPMPASPTVPATRQPRARKGDPGPVRTWTLKKLAQASAPVTIMVPGSVEIPQYETAVRQLSPTPPAMNTPSAAATPDVPMSFTGPTSQMALLPGSPPAPVQRQVSMPLPQSPQSLLRSPSIATMFSPRTVTLQHQLSPILLRVQDSTTSSQARDVSPQQFSRAGHSVQVPAMQQSLSAVAAQTLGVHSPRENLMYSSAFRQYSAPDLVEAVPAVQPILSSVSGQSLGVHATRESSMPSSTCRQYSAPSLVETVPASQSSFGMAAVPYLGSFAKDASQPSTAIRQFSAPPFSSIFSASDGNSSTAMSRSSSYHPSAAMIRTRTVSPSSRQSSTEAPRSIPSQPAVVLTTSTGRHVASFLPQAAPLDGASMLPGACTTYNWQHGSAKLPSVQERFGGVRRQQSTPSSSVRDPRVDARIATLFGESQRHVQRQFSAPPKADYGRAYRASVDVASKLAASAAHLSSGLQEYAQDCRKESSAFEESEANFRKVLNQLDIAVEEVKEGASFRSLLSPPLLPDARPPSHNVIRHADPPSGDVQVRTIAEVAPSASQSNIVSLVREGVLSPPVLQLGRPQSQAIVRQESISQPVAEDCFPESELPRPLAESFDRQDGGNTSGYQAQIPAEVCKAACFDVGSSAITGIHPLFPNWIIQDDHLVIKLSDHTILAAVFDGHGTNGHLIATFVKQVFEQYAADLMNNQGLDADVVLVSLFRIAHEGLKSERELAWLSGSTVAAAIIDAESGRMTTAHVGDTRILLMDGARIAFETRDHTITTEEKQWIVENGGEVREVGQQGIVAHRIFVPGTNHPGLAMARSLGDLEAQSVGAMSSPEICRDIPFGCQSTLLIASDGIWEKMQSADVRSCLVDASLDVQQTAAFLVDQALARWSSDTDVDDITAVVIRLAPELPEIVSNTTGHIERSGDAAVGNELPMQDFEDISVLDISNVLPHPPTESFAASSDEGWTEEISTQDALKQALRANVKLRQKAQEVAVFAQCGITPADSSVAALAEAALVARTFGEVSSSFSMSEAASTMKTVAAPAPEATPEIPCDFLPADSQFEEVPPEVLSEVAEAKVEEIASGSSETASPEELLHVRKKRISDLLSDLKTVELAARPMKLREEGACVPLDSNEATVQGVWGKGTIQGERLLWHSGDETQLLECTRTSFSMVFNGSKISAELTLDGKLHWNDGTIWERSYEAPCEPTFADDSERVSDAELFPTPGTLAAAALAAMAQPQEATIPVIPPPGPAASTEASNQTTRSWRDLTPTGCCRSLLAPHPPIEDGGLPPFVNASTPAPAGAAPNLAKGSGASLAAKAMASISNTPTPTNTPITPITPVPRRLGSSEGGQADAIGNIAGQSGAWQAGIDASDVRSPAWSMNTQPAPWGGPPPRQPARAAARQGVRHAPPVVPAGELQQRRWVIGTETPPDY